MQGQHVFVPYKLTELMGQLALNQSNKTKVELRNCCIYSKISISLGRLKRQWVTLGTGLYGTHILASLLVRAGIGSGTPPSTL